MKKLSYLIIFTVSLFLISMPIFSQIDSAGIQSIVGTSFDIVSAVTVKPIIPNVPNEITGGLITLIAGLVIRLFEKRRLRKKGHLIDKKSKDSIY